MLTEAFYTGPDGEPVDESIEPDLRVSERSRSFEELEETLDDLTLERAIEVLREGSEVDLEEAA